MDWTAFNWVDALLLLALLYGAATGAMRGLARELGTLLAFVAAGIVIRLFYEPVSAWACGRWNWDPEITRLGTIVILGAATLYGLRLFRLALGALMTFSFKGPVERLGGLLAGLLRQGAIALLLMLAASFVPVPWLQRAVMYDSAAGRAALPLLVEGYNALAERMSLLPVEIPGGVEGPIMPPLILPEGMPAPPGE